jgi:hypothetical protein
MTQGIDFITPSGPDHRPIIELHRNHDGYVAFHRRNDIGQFEPIASVPAQKLDQLFPQFIAPLTDEESFFTINGMWRPGHGQSKLVPELRAAIWGTCELRWLTACYVDFDFYKQGLTIGQAVGAVIDAQDRGIVPPASMLTRSGRGLWALWMLREEDGPGPARAWSENVACYKRIERQLIRMFESIEPDRGARDAARITRVPGSLSRVAQVRVGYWFQNDINGRPFVYTLGELAARIGVAPPRQPEGMRSVLNPAFQERARRGYAALWSKRLERLMKIISHRGMIHEGHRNRAALLLATFMHRCKIDEQEIRRTVDQLGTHRCSPPMNRDEIDAAFMKRKDFGKFTDHTIADWLHINAAESALTGWPTRGSGSADDDSMLRSRKDAMNARREHIRSLCQNRIPPLRDIKTTLSEWGIEASLPTIQADLRALGIVNPRRHHRGAATLPTSGNDLFVGPSAM